jgi:hypothetical protein
MHLLSIWLCSMVQFHRGFVCGFRDRGGFLSSATKLDVCNLWMSIGVLSLKREPDKISLDKFQIRTLSGRVH